MSVEWHNQHVPFARTVTLPLALLVVLLTVVSSVSCSRQESITKLEELRIGILPDEDIEQLAARYTPLFEYLRNEVGVSYKLVPADSYSHLVEMFRGGQIDLGRFGGLTFLQIHQQGQAAPLVMRDVDLRSTSYLLVKGNSPARRLEDCRGMSLSFGSALSTSGHLMPRHFMQKEGITPEEFFSEVRYSGAHDKTAEWVRDGEVDIGAANSHIINDMYDSGRLSRQEVRILWVTPPYPDYVWAVRNELALELRTRLRDAFLGLSSLDPDHAAILAKLEAKSFQPASIDDFAELQSIACEVGLLEEAQ